MRLIIITGTCGAGKSTLRDSLPEMLDPERYACVDSDEAGLNWWDYAGTERAEKYGEDTLKGNQCVYNFLDLESDIFCRSSVNYQSSPG